MKNIIISLSLVLFLSGCVMYKVWAGHSIWRWTELNFVINHECIEKGIETLLPQEKIRYRVDNLYYEKAPNNKRYQYSYSYKQIKGDRSFYVDVLNNKSTKISHYYGLSTEKNVSIEDSQIKSQRELMYKIEDAVKQSCNIPTSQFKEQCPTADKNYTECNFPPKDYIKRRIHKI